jgi:hypothetical protein
MRSLAKVLTFLAPVLALSTAPSYAQSGPYQYHPVTPCRLADTRSSPQGGALVNGQDKAYQVQGLCGIPSGAKAVSLNVTAVLPGGAGYLLLYPSNVTRPINVSTINFVINDIVANGAIVPLGTTASADLRVYAVVGAGTVNMVLDVSGYFQ